MVNDVDILVHFGWVVVLNLVLEVVQEQHLWLVQFLHNAFHLHLPALNLTTINLFLYFEYLSGPDLLSTNFTKHR